MIADLAARHRPARGPLAPACALALQLKREKAELDRATRNYLASKRVADNPVVKELSRTKKLTNPSLNDLNPMHYCCL